MTSATFEFAQWFSVLPVLLVAALVTWLLSLPLRNVALVEPLWSLMLFAAGVWFAMDSDPRGPRLSPVLWLLAIWSARLAWHLATRNPGQGEPRRHAENRARHEPHFAIKSLYLVFLQRALLAWIVSLPLMGAFASIRALSWLDYAAGLLWLVGFVIEAGADWQLRRFAADGANAEAVMNRGLWRYTRHPNYFGECCIWWGFYLFALAAGAWWALPGPLLVTGLLLRAAGVAPFGQTGGNRRPQYADYVLKTNAFFPAKPRD